MELTTTGRGELRTYDYRPRNGELTTTGRGRLAGRLSAPRWLFLRASMHRGQRKVMMAWALACSGLISSGAASEKPIACPLCQCARTKRPARGPELARHQPSAGSRKFNLAGAMSLLPATRQLGRSALENEPATWLRCRGTTSRPEGARQRSPIPRSKLRAKVRSYLRRR
jgi:hypothetical protein